MDSVPVEVVPCTRNDMCTNGFEYVVCVCVTCMRVCVHVCICVRVLGCPTGLIMV